MREMRIGTSQMYELKSDLLFRKTLASMGASGSKASGIWYTSNPL